MRNPRLCKAIEYAVDHWGPIDGRTRLLKLIYLADQQWFRQHGRTYTEARYFRWNHGPFAREVLSALEWMDGVEILQVPKPGFNGPAYVYQSGAMTRLNGVEIDNDFVKILTDIVTKWRDQPLQILLSHVYSDDTFGKAAFGQRLLDPEA